MSRLLWRLVQSRSPFGRQLRYQNYERVIRRLAADLRVSDDDCHRIWLCPLK